MQAEIERLKRLETLLDRQFSVGGLQFGIDSIIGLVPVVADLITGAMGFYLVQEGTNIRGGFTNSSASSFSVTTPPVLVNFNAFDNRLVTDRSHF